MKRVLLILLMFFLIFIQVQNKAVNGQDANCAGVGNYCVGTVVQQFGDYCYYDENSSSCQTQWLSTHTGSCSPSTCATTAGTAGMGECGSSSTPQSCNTEFYGDTVTLSCCLYAGGGGGGGSCDTTAPSNLSANCDYSASQERFSWTPGQGLSRVNQYIAASATLTDLQQPTNCNPAAGANCIIMEPLSIYDSSYIADKSLFTPGTTYYWGVISVANPLSCSKRTLSTTVGCPFVPTATPTPTPTPLPPSLSCSLIGSTIRWSWPGAQALLQVSGVPWLFNAWSSSPVDTSGGTPGNTYTGTATFTGGNPWSNPVSCTIPNPTPTLTLTPTNTPTPTMTPTPAQVPWTKLKDTSYISQNSLTSMYRLF